MTAGAATAHVASDGGAVRVELGVGDWNQVVQMLDQRGRYSALSGLGAVYSTVADRIVAQLPDRRWPRLTVEVVP